MDQSPSSNIGDMDDALMHYQNHSSIKLNSTSQLLAMPRIKDPTLSVSLPTTSSCRLKFGCPIWAQFLKDVVQGNEDSRIVSRKICFNIPQISEKNDYPMFFK